MPSPAAERSVAGERDAGASDQTSRASGLDALGAGHALPTSVRAYFEPRFGHDFGDVRVHTGSRAAESAQAVGAKAFTYGRSIVFGSQRYDPASDKGRRLLAHELTHVVQQTSGPRAQRRIQRAEIDDDPKLCAGLLDSTSVLDALVNSVLDSVRNIPDGRERVETVYKALGSGSPFSHIEEWAEGLPPTHQNRVPISHTRFSTTFHGRRTGSGMFVNAWMKGERAIGTLLNIGGHCVGSDKLGHFFQQGRDYFYISGILGKGDEYAVGFGEWLEGIMPADPEVKAWIEKMNEQKWPGFDRLMWNFPFWKGVFGLNTTGVYSRGDLEANRAGMEFYKRVYASPSTKFSAAAYVNGQWNERMNPSCFGPTIAKLVAANDPEFLRAYRTAVQAAVSKNKYAYSAYHAKGTFESLVQPYVRKYLCR